ncbi:MAG: PxxKW family cysteine-rich protein [Deltaproteobacteria bacterium]|nr:PxxKW family cysteine-rich protein [Deltaproteobacteria bacterium]
MAKASKIKAPENTEQYSSGFFKPVIEKCEGCDRVIEVDNSKYCHTYAVPDAKWRLGICNFATHVKHDIQVIKVKVNPLKAAKRASGKKK